jgi:hypoxanthine phosphoribosyltransferase
MSDRTGVGSTEPASSAGAGVDGAGAREVMSWDDLGTGARDLAQVVADDGWMPDMILGIARGGLLVAGALGYALGVKNTFTMNVEFYTGVDERLEMPMILPPVPDLIDFADFKVLIADDVADTGATLKLVQEFCEGKVAEVRCAVLYEKPRSTVRCEYVWRRTDRWITFPWSAEDPVGAGSTEPAKGAGTGSAGAEAGNSVQALPGRV